MAADVTGFLFGNINSNWEVEGADDYLNKSGIQYLSKHLSEQQEELLSSADAEDSFGDFPLAFSNDDGTGKCLFYLKCNKIDLKLNVHLI